MDWNNALYPAWITAFLSPSARKVWIEISENSSKSDNTVLSHLPRGRCGLKWALTFAQPCRLRHLPRGRCGLKLHLNPPRLYNIWSPSARKVWIEMSKPTKSYCWPWVTFREEGVDWNLLLLRHLTVWSCEEWSLKLYFFTAPFPEIIYIVCRQSDALLSRSHYRTLLQVKDPKAHNRHDKKAAEKKINQKLIFILHIKPQSDRYNTHDCGG